MSASRGSGGGGRRAGGRPAAEVCDVLRQAQRGALPAGGGLAGGAGEAARGRRGRARITRLSRSLQRDLSAAAHSSAQPPAPVLRPGFAMHTSAVMSPNRSCEKWGASVGCDVVCLVQKFASAGRRRMRSAARCSAAH